MTKNKLPVSVKQPVERFDSSFTLLTMGQNSNGTIRPEALTGKARPAGVEPAA